MWDEEQPDVAKDTREKGKPPPYEASKGGDEARPMRGFPSFGARCC
jgi:hypothetical protein